MTRVHLIILLALSIIITLNEASILPDQYLQGRIVGGLAIDISFFPYQISLQLREKHVCGGAILDAKTIITAAHCVLEYNEPQNYAIRAGSSEYDKNGQYIKVKRIIPHEEFHVPTKLNNDIAILSLMDALNFSSTVQPIEISLDLLPYHVLYISGWGAVNNEESILQSRLRYTSVLQLDQAYCAWTYEHIATVTINMLCAGSPIGGHDTCQGDSGGPLVAYVNGNIQLYGIASWGLGCGDARFPGVYMRASKYDEWIKNTKNKLLL